MKAFDRGAVAQALESLRVEAHLAFGLSCCERLFPNYLAFMRETGWGDSGSLRAALDLAWGVLDGAAPSSDALSRAEEAVRDAEPETEDFETILVSSALDAAVCTGLLLQFLREGGTGKIAEIASLCRDTVDMFVQDMLRLDRAAPNFEDEIRADQLMQRELQRQRDDLAELKSFSNLTSEVAALRTRWRSVKSSNIEQSG